MTVPGNFLLGPVKRMMNKTETFPMLTKSMVFCEIDDKPKNKEKSHVVLNTVKE